jgi:hypothetical protein
LQSCPRNFRPRGNLYCGVNPRTHYLTLPYISTPVNNCPRMGSKEKAPVTAGAWEVFVSDRLKNTADSHTPARGKHGLKSSQRRWPSSFKCPYCHRTVDSGLVAADARIGRNPQKAPLFFEALSLHSRGHSWAEIAKRLDPHEFKKDPARARERFRKGAAHYASSLGWLLVPEVPPLEK